MRYYTRLARVPQWPQNQAALIKGRARECRRSPDTAPCRILGKEPAIVWDIGNSATTWRTWFEFPKNSARIAGQSIRLFGMSISTHGAPMPARLVFNARGAVASNDLIAYRLSSWAIGPTARVRAPKGARTLDFSVMC